MAGDKSAVTLAKVTKLLELATELHQKEGEVIAEAMALLGGGQGVAEKMKDIERSFDAAWCARYAAGQSGKYIWQYAQTRPNIKRLLHSLDVDEIKRRILRYMRDDDPFIARPRHPFGLFVAGINKYAAAGEAPPEFALEGDDRPTGCMHDPPCSSDAEHTARRGRELRS